MCKAEAKIAEYIAAIQNFEFVYQLLKEGELDNFAVDALNWSASDGLAIFVTTIFLPPIYSLQEHDLI